MRNSEIKRVTNETDISLILGLDGGETEISTGCGFLDHMLELFACHGSFGLKVNCKGDTFVDYHHTVEDIGIALGGAFREALGDRAGITRYGNIILPMDEALILCAADISGRAVLQYDLGELNQKVGDFDTELVEEFFLGFVRHAQITLHVKKLSGSNTHHIIEGAFKAFARTLKQASTIDKALEGKIPSSKGIL